MNSAPKRSREWREAPAASVEQACRRAGIARQRPQERARQAPKRRSPAAHASLSPRYARPDRHRSKDEQGCSRPPRAAAAVARVETQRHRRLPSQAEAHGEGEAPEQATAPDLGAARAPPHGWQQRRKARVGHACGSRSSRSPSTVAVTSTEPSITPAACRASPAARIAARWASPMRGLLRSVRSSSWRAMTAGSSPVLGNQQRLNLGPGSPARIAGPSRRPSGRGRGLGLVGQELLAHVQDAVGIRPRACGRTAAPCPRSRPPPSSGPARPRHRRRPGQRRLAVGMLQQDRRDVGFRQAHIGQRADQEGVRIGAARHRGPTCPSGPRPR